MKIIKKVIAYPLMWGFFWIGHLISRTMFRIDFLGWLYPVYNNLMFWSADIQDWGEIKKGVWRKPLPQEEDT